ncbi:hypothetical protein FF1_015670 [Malus domestica]
MAGRGRERGVRLPKSGVRVDFFSSNQGSLKDIHGDGEDDGGTTVGSFVQVIVLEIYDLLSSNGGGGFGFGWPKSNVSNSKVEASTNQLADQQMPVYNLASKILCRVINVSLKAEPDNDEVFAQVTLLPESNQDENAVEKEIT